MRPKKSKTTLIGLKVTPAELALIEMLVSAIGYKSRGDVLRDGLMNLAGQYRVSGDIMQAIRLERIAHPLRKRTEEEEELVKGCGIKRPYRTRGQE